MKHKLMEVCRMKFQQNSCEICDGQSDPGGGFLQVLPILIRPNAPFLSSINQDW
jgi:hypothetical protein